MLLFAYVLWPPPRELLNLTQTFFSNFSDTRRISLPGFPAQKFGFLGLRRKYRTFLPPPLHVGMEDPHATGTRKRQESRKQRRQLRLPQTRGLIAGVAKITETTEMTKTTGIWGAKPRFPKTLKAVMVLQ